MIKLWNQTMPHRCVEDAFEPYLTPYDCDAAKTAIVVCPGGAYCGRADYEGNDVGAWLNTIGITAFVLEYRVAPSKAPAQPSDAQRAMRLARKLCMEHGIERLGIMGFSAGGHLAATLSVHYDEAFYPPQDELDNLSACPDFTVLCYSVIDMGEYRHDWSRRFLLGDVPDEAQIEFYRLNQTRGCADRIAGVLQGTIDVGVEDIRRCVQRRGISRDNIEQIEVAAD